MIHESEFSVKDNNRQFLGHEYLAEYSIGSANVTFMHISLFRWIVYGNTTVISITRFLDEKHLPESIDVDRCIDVRARRAADAEDCSSPRDSTVLEGRGNEVPVLRAVSRKRAPPIPMRREFSRDSMPSEMARRACCWHGIRGDGIPWQATPRSRVKITWRTLDRSRYIHLEAFGWLKVETSLSAIAASEESCYYSSVLHWKSRHVLYRELGTLRRWLRRKVLHEMMTRLFLRITERSDQYSYTNAKEDLISIFKWTHQVPTDFFLVVNRNWKEVTFDLEVHHREH